MSLIICCTSSSVGVVVPVSFGMISVIMPWLCMRRGAVKQGIVVAVNVLWHGLTAGVVVVGCKFVTGFSLLDCYATTVMIDGDGVRWKCMLWNGTVLDICVDTLWENMAICLCM